MKNKILYLEILRIFSIFFVIFNHTGDMGFFMFKQYQPSDILYWIYLFISVFCKISVPMFMAISGALTLNKKETPKNWGTRIFKMAIILLIVSLVYYARMIYKTPDIEINMKSFVTGYIKGCISGTISAHLWYLYMYIGYLCIVPYLRVLVQNLETKYFYYMFIFMIAYGIVVCAEWLQFGGSLKLSEWLKGSWRLSNTIIYPCLGYFMHNRLDLKNRKSIVLLWGLNVILIVFTCYTTFVQGKAYGEYYEWFHSCFSVVNMVTVFLNVRYIFKTRTIPVLLEKCILSAGACTFGIYLFHQIVMGFYWRCIPVLRNYGINYMISTWIMCVLVLCTTWICVWIMSKIPFVKRIVGF